jgi:soluble lytic murein transglycosylase-like protein
MKYNLLVFLCVLIFLSQKPYEKPYEPTRQEIYGQITGHPEIVDIIYKVNQDYNIEPEILIAICWRESNFDPDAIGRNANSYDQGLMQLNSIYFSGEYVTDPLINCTIAIHHFNKALIKANGNLSDALRIYNSGNIRRTAQKEKYVSAILQYYMNLRGAK